MKRVPKKQKTKIVANDNACREIILGDGSSIRTKIRAQYQRVLTDTEKANMELALFRENDEPEYSRWYHATFGALITQERELLAKRQELERLHQDVVLQFTFGEYRSMSEAYHAYLEMLKEEEEAVRRAAENQPGSGDDEDKYEDEKFKSFEDFFNDLFGMGGDPDEEEEESGRRKNHGRQRRQGNELPPQKRSDQEVSARVKQLYRMLVRKLHPDCNGDSTPAQLDLWHQAQEAYEKDDAPTLEAILAICEIQEKGTHAHTSMSALLQVINKLKRSLLNIRGQLREAQKNPAWQFTRYNEVARAHLKERFETRLKQNIATLREQVKAFETEIDSWKQSPPRPRSRSRKKRKVSEE
ncbi:MAG: J domain-containing protein [Verrucomicrobiales bacterium]